MRPIATFLQRPSLPPRLARLHDIAHNLRWTWDHDSRALFRRLDADLWTRMGHNPVLLLGRIDQSQLERAASDAGFLANLDRVAAALDDYLHSPSTWFDRLPDALPDRPLVAYCSAEFGLTESLSIFAGGLGVLAGDHLKSASDLGVPLVGVGLLYRQGYFRQQITAAGRQHETYEENDVHTWPLTLERTAGGAPVVVRVDLPGRAVAAQVWRAQVGRVPLFLLDTDVAVNAAPDRAITYQLYGGDSERRLQQEIVLGVGGARALAALGIAPTVWHMNEGHAAFLALERVRQVMGAHALDFATARELAAPGLVFTTHTPVPAGHDRFTPELLEAYFADYAQALGLAWSDFLALGRERGDDPTETFTMTVLALRLAAWSNGVSRLHGAVSRAMWQGLWPALPAGEVPIGHVTNGVHFPSWVSRDVADLYDRYLGPRWREEPADAGAWRHVDRIPADELWRTHERGRERLVDFARRRVRAQLVRRGAAPSEADAADAVLDTEALTIGFARRFATYKRATLLFHDPDRLARLLAIPGRPVQVVIAGKAHPRDEAGKALIAQVSAFTREERFRGRVVFLEDYDLDMARALTQGADVWLNTPLPPNEASGTSGMKAAANGALNVSTSDGWWTEAWADADPDRPPIGWTITSAADADAENAVARDAEEADALYDLLERDVIPCFYDRDDVGLPRTWIARVKSATAQLCHHFNAHRMVREYAERYYVPGAAAVARRTADDAAEANLLAEWRNRITSGWSQVTIGAVEADAAAELPVGTPIRVRARVALGPLTPADVRVELYLGRLNVAGDIIDPGTTRLLPPADTTVFRGEPVLFEASGVACPMSGLHGFTVRVRPELPDTAAPSVALPVTWARAEAMLGGITSLAGDVDSTMPSVEPRELTRI